MRHNNTLRHYAITPLKQITSLRHESMLFLVIAKSRHIFGHTVEIPLFQTQNLLD